MNQNTPTNAPTPSPAALDVMVRIIMSQTDMTHDEVISALERTQYDLKKVIREYMTTSASASASTSTSTSASAVSTNQLRFSEIRNFMDKSAETFRRNQEITRIHQQVMEKKKQQATVADAIAVTDVDEAVSNL
jgi:aspartate oxidase